MEGVYIGLTYTHVYERLTPLNWSVWENSTYSWLKHFLGREILILRMETSS